MAKRYVHNDGPNVIFVGGVMLPPGQGREVDEQFLPPADPPAGVDNSPGHGEPQAGGDDNPGPDAEVLRANLVEMIKKPLKALLPMLEGFSDFTLQALHELENEAPAPRVTLLNAIAALQLQRAEVRTQAGAAGGPGADGGEGAAAASGGADPGAPS